MSWQDTLSKLEAEAEQFLETAEEDVVAAAEKLEPLAEAAFSKLLDWLGSLAVSLVGEYLGKAGAGMVGLEKQKSVALRLQEHAVGQGKTLSLQDATTVAQNAFDSFRKVGK